MQVLRDFHRIDCDEVVLAIESVKMPNIALPVRRVVLIGGFALAVAVAPAVGLFAGPSPTIGSPTATCPPGLMRDPFTSVCVSGVAPPGSIGAPTHEALTACSGSRRSACLQGALYGNYANLGGW